MVDPNSYSVVIPLHPRHSRECLSLVKQSRGWTVPPSQIVVAASELSESRSIRYRSELEAAGSSEIPIVLVSQPGPATAGVNRNRGWELVSQSWTAFLDADDFYRPERSEMLLDVARETGSEALVHSYAYRVTPRSFLALPIARDGERWTPGNEIHRLTFPGGKRERVSEFGDYGRSNIALPRGGPSRVHHGHLFLRTELRHRFSYEDLPIAEDGIFVRDLIESGVSFAALPEVLSLYKPLKFTWEPKEAFRQARWVLLGE